MGLFDWFVAPLRCRSCGAVSDADGSTDVQTKLHDSPRQNYLGVGAALVVTRRSAEESGYSTLREPGGPEVLILQNWVCRTCKAWPPLWLEVSIRDGRIAGIESVDFEPALKRAHFIEDESLLLYAAGVPGAPPMLNDTALALTLLRTAHPGRAGP